MTTQKRFLGTLRDLLTHRIAWPKTPAQIEHEKTLREGVLDLQRHALETAHELGQVGDADYWECRLELEKAEREPPGLAGGAVRWN